MLLFFQCNLPGFYDPCVGEDKQLWVQYRFHNNVHEVTVKDSETLRIPKTCKHALKNLIKMSSGKMFQYDNGFLIFVPAHRVNNPS